MRGREEGGVEWREGVAEPCAWEVERDEADAVVPETILIEAESRGALTVQERKY